MYTRGTGYAGFAAGLLSAGTCRGKPALTGEQAWAAIAGFVLVHELSCREGQLLSEAVDRGVVKRPLLTYLAVLTTTAHLLNWLPKKLDPYWWVWELTKKGNNHR